MAGEDRHRQEEFVVTYADQEGRRHRIVVRGGFVLDLSAGRPAILVAELSHEEGIEQAEAVVFGGEFDAGYLARAEAGEAALGRRLTAEDLRRAHRAEPEHGDAVGQADDERRLAA
jgi:hypothetical protein